MKFSPRALTITLYSLLIIGMMIPIGIGIVMINELNQPISRQLNRAFYRDDFDSLKNQINNLKATGQPQDEEFFTFPDELRPLYKKSLESLMFDTYEQTFITSPDHSVSIAVWPYGQIGFANIVIPAIYRAGISVKTTPIYDSTFSWGGYISDATSRKEPLYFDGFVSPVLQLPELSNCGTPALSFKHIASGATSCDDEKLQFVKEFEFKPELCAEDLHNDTYDCYTPYYRAYLTYKDEPLNTEFITGSSEATVVLVDANNQYLTISLSMLWPSYRVLCYEGGCTTREELSPAEIDTLEKRDKAAITLFKKFAADLAQGLE